MILFYWALSFVIFFIFFVYGVYLCRVLVKLTHNFFSEFLFFRLNFFSFPFIDIRLLVLELCNFSFFPFHGVISSRGWVKLTLLTQFFYVFYWSNFDLFSRSFFNLIFFILVSYHGSRVIRVNLVWLEFFSASNSLFEIDFF